MPSKLLFVTTVGERPSTPDATTKTLIKKHVMHDIGLSRRGYLRRSKYTENEVGSRVSNSTRRCIKSKSATPVSDVSDTDKSTPHSYVESISGLGTPDTLEEDINFVPIDDATVAFTCQTRVLRHEAEQLCDLMAYYAPLCNMHPLYTSGWLPLSFLDTASFYQIYALLTSYVRSRHASTAANSKFSINCLIIYGRAVRETNARLDDPSLRYSDGTVAAIGASMQQAFIHHNFALYDVHLEALNTIIQHRGGLSCIEPNTQSMISWSDIMGACILDRKPRFPLPNCMPDLKRLLAGETPSHTFRAISDAWRTKLPSQSTLIDVFDDMAVLISSGKRSKIQKIWQDKALVHRIILNLLHRLQNDQSCTDKNSIICNEIAQLVKLGFMLSMAGRARSIGLVPESIDALLAALRKLLLLDTIDWTGLEPIQHWVLCAAAREEAEVGETWFARRIETTAGDLPITERRQMLSDMRAISFELSDFSCIVSPP